MDRRVCASWIGGAQGGEQQCAFWIKGVRKKNKLSQTEFGKRVYQYVTAKSGKVCRNYHRNTIANWEAGREVPRDLESFLSIALLDYDWDHGPCKNCDERNERYQYARELMRQMLGVDLYCRNLHDALLIQVCRAVISFEEVLELEPELDALIRKLNIDREEKRGYALQTATEMIQRDLFQINGKEQIREVVEKNLVFFYTGNRTLGERWRWIYEGRDRYPEKLSMEEAVQIYAPNYQNSYKKLFFSSGMTRHWLLDLCIHLRFDRGELQAVLRYAHMAPLPDGSWAEGDAVGQGSRFPEVYRMPLRKKLKLLLLITGYVAMEEWQALPPVDCILESFEQYDQGKTVLGRLDQWLSGIDPEAAIDWEDAYIQEQLAPVIGDWDDYLRVGYEAAAIRTSVSRVYESHRNEHGVYYDMPDRKCRGIRNREEACRLRYAAALYYTVFLGKYFNGQLTEKDLRLIREQFEDADYIYKFISQFLGIFLDSRELLENREKKFYVVDGDGQRVTRMLDMAEILQDILASVIELCL